jgi:hypothetical protein
MKAVEVRARWQLPPSHPGRHVTRSPCPLAHPGEQHVHGDAPSQLIIADRSRAHPDRGRGPCPSMRHANAQNTAKFETNKQRIIAIKREISSLQSEFGKEVYGLLTS